VSDRILRDSTHPGRSAERATSGLRVPVDHISFGNVRVVGVIEIIVIQEDALARTVQAAADRLICEAIRNWDDALATAGVVTLSPAESRTYERPSSSSMNTWGQ